MFWNLARGKVGSIVVSVNKGQVITRQYQPNVSNPRTRPQILQRARFANCVEFYKRATGNFFRFAYEDKKPTESDYNAFMRHNVGASVGLLKYDQTKGNFPAVASHWTLTAGSLAEVALQDVRTAQPYLSIPTGDYQTQTVGALSQSLVDSYNLMSGDIVTIVRVTSDVTTLNSSIPNNPPKWEIAQFIVRTTDSTPISNIMEGISLSTGKGLILDTAARPYFALYGVVFSRKTSNGLLVSTSLLEANSVAYDMWSNSKSADWQNACYASWNAAGDAVLEGSLVSSTSNAIIETVSGENVPRISPTSLGAGVSSSAVITGSGFTNLTIDQFSGYGCRVTALDVRDDQSATITITGTGEHPNSWELYFAGSVIARHTAAEPAITSVTPGNVSQIGNGDTAVFTINGTNVDAIKKEDITTDNAQLTVASVQYVSGSQIKVTLSASAEVTSAKVSYDGNVIFQVADVVINITSSSQTLSTAGSHTLNLAGTGLNSLTKESFSVSNGQITSYTAAEGGATATLGVSVTDNSNGYVKYGAKEIAKWQLGAPDFS